MALTQKNLTIDGEHLRELAERRGMSESAAAREAIDAALFTDNFLDLVQQLHDAGFGVTSEDDAPPADQGEAQ